MPPFLALLLCSAFVWGLLRIERAQSGGVSRAVWIPTAWVMAVSSKPLALWFGIAGSNETGSWLDRVFLGCLAAAGLVLLVYRRHNWRESLRGSRWLLALLGYMLVSTLWSDIPLIAVKRWFREAIIVVAAMVLLSEASPRDALESVFRRTS